MDTSTRRLDGKVAIVTGASTGIGRAIAQGLAREGCAIVLAARDRERLHEAADEIRRGGVSHALAIPTDVTVEEAVQALFDQAVAQFGRLDVLINNAGIFDGGPIDELTLDVWERVMAVNLRGPFLCTRAALRIMKRQGSGRIINIGSVAALRVRPNSAPYSTSKHGLRGLTEVTALEGRPYGIACSCLHPGNTRVATLAGTAAAGDPIMEVDEVASAAVYMAIQPPHVNVLEMVVLPVGMPFLGRG